MNGYANMALASCSSRSLNTFKSKKRRKIFIEDVITKNPENAEPCLVRFSNGVVRHPKSISGNLYQNISEKQIRKRKERKLIVTNSRLSYIGKNFGDVSGNDVNERFFLGILDKNSDKMKLVEMSNFTLHPHVDLSDPLNNTTLIEPQLTYNQKQAKLCAGFGGKRARMKVKKRAENEVNIEDMSSALQDALSSVALEEVPDITEKVELFKNVLPPCNREAVDINEVYPLESIVSIDELLYFNDAAVEYLENNEVDEESHSPLFLQTLVKSKFIEQEHERAKIICIALYVEQIISLLKAKPSCIRKKKSPWQNCPKPIQEKLYSSFTEGKDRVKTKSLEDKMIAYVLILALLANKYEIHWKPLSHSLGIQKERLENIIRASGATYKKDTSVIELKLPLSQLTSSGNRKRKRKY